MALIEIVREVDVDPDEAWARLTRWPDHGRYAPLTTVLGTESGFVARTAVGPFGFDDPMEIVRWDPPRFCRLEKRGRVVLGWAEIMVAPRSGGRSSVVWREDIRVRGLPRRFDPLTEAASRRLFTRVLDGLLAGPVASGRA